ncbi:MAG TPA: hypothetical protein VMW83_13265 [Spirochaetia bacterium]|nr:hypothetical protein [Spirochaetia bacterium]
MGGANDEASLRKLLERLQEDLEELEEEKVFTLSQTGLHVTGGAVKKFEADLRGLKERIKDVEEQLRQCRG